MNDKYRHLLENLRSMGRVAVAFSGGVDSSFLLFASHSVLAGQVHAITVFSPMTPPGERETAIRTAREIGLDLIPLEIDLTAVRSIARNRPDRCYHCKRLIFKEIRRLATRRKIRWILEGSNLDDLSDFRPGRRAAIEMGIRMPLQEAGLTKVEIRTLAREAGLSNWDLPSQACLASRIPFGDRITPDRLARIASAESVLRELGFLNSRIRDHYPVARIEILQADFVRLIQSGIRERLTEQIRSCGFSFVTLDLDGYRQGSMNPLVDDRLRSSS